MPFATWWRGDPLPVLTALPGFSARPVTRWAEAQTVTGLTEGRVIDRLSDGNTLYAAYLAGQPAGYGWLARQVGRISELHLSFTMPPGNAYLWDFVTAPAYRGRGVYPHLLQAILAEEDALTRFWIGYEAHNTASARGIEKAGFQVIGDLVVQAGEVSAVTLENRGERGRAIADIFGLPVTEDA
ncbi:MAG: GNAT family N-acetyltransferase [Chloroflexota bacterium]